MKTAVCTRPDHVELQERPVPELKAGFVLIRVSVCGICGSDVAAWRGSGHKTFPHSPGHEFCGVIERMGEGVPGLALGQRVVINPNLGCGACRFCEMGRPNLCDSLKTRPIKSNGGLAEYVALDYRMAHPLPDGLPDELAPFVEPLSCALHMADAARVEPGDRVAIFGAGLTGFLTGMVLASAGADVVLVEPAERRRRRAAELLDLPVVAAGAPAGEIDAAVDCSGSGHAVAEAVRALRKAGRLILAGLVASPDGAGISLIDVTTKELEIKGAWLNPNTFDRAIETAAASKDVLQNLETETFSLDDVKAAFVRAASPDAPKVLVRP